MHRLRQRLLRTMAMTIGVSSVAHAQGASRLAGCYSFNTSVFTWTAYEHWSESVLQGSSTLIELMRTLAADSEGARGFQLRVPSLLDSAEAARWAAGSSWRVVEEDSVVISWYNGLFGPLLRLQARGDSLVGHYSYRSDLNPGAPPKWRPIVGERRPCPRASESVRRRPDVGW